jgi:molybdate transport system substrate-binding protein
MKPSITCWFGFLAIAMCAGCTPSAPPSGPPAAAAVAQSAAPAEPTTVTVAAASDLKFALDEVIAEFKTEHPTTEVTVTYGSSGNFFAQLSNKAPFDIYFSADIEYPRKLIEAGHADKATEFQYAIGQIVVWASKSSPLDVEGQGVQALLDPSVQKIAVANPEHAPYGRAAEAAMKKLGVYDQVKDKLVLGENISQTAQFIETGAADVGIIALSLALASAMSEKGKYAKVPLDAYPTMEQGGVILNWAKDPVAAQELREFVMGEQGRAILKRYGFLLPGE